MGGPDLTSFVSSLRNPSRWSRVSSLSTVSLAKWPERYDDQGRPRRGLIRPDVLQDQSGQLRLGPDDGTARDRLRRLRLERPGDEYLAVAVVPVVDHKRVRQDPCVLRVLVPHLAGHDLYGASVDHLLVERVLEVGREDDGGRRLEEVREKAVAVLDPGRRPEYVVRIVDDHEVGPRAGVWDDRQHLRDKERDRQLHELRVSRPLEADYRALLQQIDEGAVFCGVEALQGAYPAL